MKAGIDTRVVAPWTYIQMVEGKKPCPECEQDNLEKNEKFDDRLFCDWCRLVFDRLDYSDHKTAVELLATIHDGDLNEWEDGFRDSMIERLHKSMGDLRLTNPQRTKVEQILIRHKAVK